MSFLLHPIRIVAAVSLMAGAASVAPAQESSANWPNWRGPLQNGVSLEHYKNSKVDTEPAWTYATRGRGAPVLFDGRLFSWGYRGAGENLVEVLTALDAKTGKMIWEHEFNDFLSDTIYDRYSIGAPTVDPETKQVYLMTHYGLLLCFDFDGKELWRISMSEDFGKLSFPNARVGSAVIEGDLVIARGITSNWGADGPAADRFYAYDKRTGELVWWSMPGITPPVDSSFSTPVFETRFGKRVFYAGTGCGNIICVNARNGKPIFRFQAGKNGMNASVVLHGDKVIGIHNDENVDSSDKGRLAAVNIPKEAGAPAEGQTTVVLEPSAEAWRAPLAATSSSPIVVGDRLYQQTDGGELHCLNIETGEIIWTKKLSNSNLHASPLYVDGLLYCPFTSGKLFVVKPGEKDAEIVQEISVEGQCLGAVVVCDGKLYLHTTEKFYCFNISHEGLTRDAEPVVEIPVAGKPAAIQAIPAEVVLTPGHKAKFRLRSVDANGFVVGDIKEAKWASFVPPTARVKATMDAAFNEAGELVAAENAKLSAGAFKATTADGLTGTIRGRVLQNLPIVEDFNQYELNEDQPRENIKFAYPPLPWIGARFKFDVRELEGEKVFAKTFDRILFQRATVFVGRSDLANYTAQVDVLTDGTARVKSDIGLINQRYLICLRSNAGKLEVSSNLERLAKTAPFKVKPNAWYTLKTRVDSKEDGSGVVLAKVWERGQAEPDAWTIEVPVARVHKNGSPGIFSFTPLNQRRAYLDNLSITPNQ
ncbi:PQQ-binding-like beta-propeller repeat protein [Phragmitibacter flavus]|nr:PQQ-binding-like beta-propeller repeat protein [Phragmitibacter flavus]